MKDYKTRIESSPLVLMEFYASWCPHCQRMKPIIESVKRKMDGRVAIYRYDVDRNPALTDAEDVEVYPTYILYKHGKEVCRNSGEMPEEELLKAIRHYE